ncbi:unnamed protein product [Arctia plantaginis]|uniref:FLYWCH-type domain-containing protein n=1 Tax=Arctia plantaginis TaxID=874455 RepID=A0A8S1AT48_ARCPL|nr:unnamed protein product [Arctia plantaginis]
MRHPKGRRFVGDVQVERDFLDLLETFEVALSEEAANNEIQNLQNSLDLGNMNFEESANLEAVNSQESTNSRAENFQRPANSMIAISQRPANVEGTNFQEPAILANNGSRSNSSSPVRVTYVYSRRGKKLVLTESGFTYCYHATHRQNKMHWVCSTHYSRGCRADVRIQGDIILEEKNTHKHRPRTVNWLNERPMNYLNVSAPPIHTAEPTAGTSNGH